MTRDHRSVARELDGLLGRSPIARGPRTPSSPPPLPTPAASPPPRRRRRWGPVLVAGLLAGVGLNGAIWLTTDRPEPKTIGGKRAEAPAETAPVAPASTEVAATTPQAPAVLPTIEAAPPVELADAPVPAQRVAPAPAGEAAVEAAAVPARREAVVRCDRLAPQDEVDCLYDRLLAADRRLAAAYEQAVDAGVPNRELRDLRRDWTYARRFAEDDPEGVASTYDAIAGDLRQASRDAARVRRDAL